MPLEGMHLGHYRLLRLLGSGGMGEVYLAEDARIGQQVAIKVVRSEGLAYPHSESAKEASRLFEREAKAIARLDHPNILPLYAYGEEALGEQVLTYLVMPYRREGTLASWLRLHAGAAPLSPAAVAPLLQQAAAALQHAHDQHVLHQDLKPTNFLIRLRSDQPEWPDVLLSDFGIAKLTSATGSLSQSIRGTPAYMAPEQWEGHPVAASDQYGLAIMIYELLVGRPPFVGNPGQVMYQHALTPPPAPSSLGEHLSPAIDAVLLCALAKQPGGRFPDVRAFARAFQEAMQSEGDLYATLTISRAEAENGTTRTLTVPGGRRVSVPVPAGVEDGTILRLEGQGMPSYEGGPAGPLVLTIAIAREGSPPALLQDSTALTVAGSIRNTELPPVGDLDVPAARPEAPDDLAPTVPASNASETASTVLATAVTSLPVPTEVSTLLPARPEEGVLSAVMIGGVLSLVSLLFTNAIPLLARTDPDPSYLQVLPPLVLSLMPGVLLRKSGGARQASLVAGLVLGVSWFIFILVKYAGILSQFPPSAWLATLACAAACGPLSWLGAWLTTHPNPSGHPSSNRNEERGERQERVPHLSSSPASPPVARWFALAGVVGPIFFLALFTLVGFLRPGYSPVRQVVSDLGVGPAGWIFDGSAVLTGLLLITFALGFALSMGAALSQRQRWLSAALLALHGLGYIIGGIFPDAPATLVIHLWVGATLVFFSPVVAFFVTGLLLGHNARWQGWSSYSLLASLTTFALALLTFLFFLGVPIAAVPIGGILERLLFVEISAWYVAFGWRLFVGQRLASGGSASQKPTE